MENSSDNRVIQDIQLEQNPISGGIFAGADVAFLSLGSLLSRYYSGQLEDCPPRKAD